MANGQLQEAVQAFETARATDPKDPELAFLLGSAYLQIQKLDEAERLFAEVIKAHPGPETDVLLGRTYRDAAQYDRARVVLRRALKADPKARRAHYYLGTTAILAEGSLGLDEAIREFKAELQSSPKDVLTNLRLGMALVEARRNAEALPHLEIARAAEPPPAEAFYYLGRCHLALNRAPEAVEAFRRALSLAGHHARRRRPLRGTSTISSRSPSGSRGTKRRRPVISKKQSARRHDGRTAIGRHCRASWPTRATRAVGECCRSTRRSHRRHPSSAPRWNDS